jgi:tRNA-intron endonuclease
MTKKIDVELIENFLVVWNPEDGTELYKNGFYGKPLGISKPKIPEFKVPLILDLMEGVYLAQRKKIAVRKAEEKESVSVKKLRQEAKNLYDEFDNKY